MNPAHKSAVKLFMERWGTLIAIISGIGVIFTVFGMVGPPVRDKAEQILTKKVAAEQAATAAALKKEIEDRKDGDIEDIASKEVIQTELGMIAQAVRAGPENVAKQEAMLNSVTQFKAYAESLIVWKNNRRDQ